jgi:2'-5' RNA ligase
MQPEVPKAPKYYAAIPLPSSLVELTKTIQLEDLDVQPDKDPIERSHHITLHVLLPHLPDSSFQSKIKAVKPFNIQFAGLGCFENKSNDVLFARIQVTDELLNLHKLLVGEYKQGWGHKEYTAHATLAFLKPGKAKSYAETIQLPPAYMKTTIVATNVEFRQHASPLKNSKDIMVLHLGSSV